MAAEARRRTSGRLAGWLFLLGVCVVYAAVFVARPELAIDALGRLAPLLVQVVPILALVFVLMFLSDLFLEGEWIKRHLGRRADFAGWCIALGAGVVSMGPIVAWYPLLSDLRQKGARAELVAAFLYSRAIKLPLLPLMIHSFGLSYTIVLTVCMLAFSVVSGLVTAQLAGIDPPAGGEAPARSAGSG